MRLPFAIVLLLAGCSAARQPPRVNAGCGGPVSCGREQLVEADQSLQHAIQQRGLAGAFADVLADDAKVLLEGDGLLSGKPAAVEALSRAQPFTWRLARADVSTGVDLGYSFGWTSRGHYAAVWRRAKGGWMLAAFLHKAATSQDAPPPSWFAPFRGDRDAPGAPPSSDVAAADSAFAALARQSGTQHAFTAYAAQDAVQLARTMVFGRDAIHRLLEGAPVIDWKPIASGSAQDLGYTIGAFTVGSSRGHYLTIWRLQPDGSWRFVVDGGISA